MRIVLTSNYKIGNETGASAITDLLARKLAQKNKVIYICLGKKLELIHKSKGLTLLTLPSLYLKGIDFPLITPQSIFLINKELDKFNPDVIHLQNHILVSNIVQLWGNLKGVAVVTTFHHIPSESLKHLLPNLNENIFAKLVQDFYTQTTLKNFLSKCFAIISLNKKQYKEIKKINKNIKNIIINNGIEINKFLKIERKRPDKQFHFVFLGSYMPRKNQLFLIKTFKHLPNNFKLNLYGNFKSGNGYLDKLKKFIKINQVNNVFLNDFINAKKIFKIYQKSHYFISASLKEVQSLAVIEALASGLPVIGLKNETITDLVNMKNGLALPKNTTQIIFAKKIVDFVKNSNYQKMSKEAKKTSSRFNIDKTILKIEKLYKSARNSNS